MRYDGLLAFRKHTRGDANKAQGDLLYDFCVTGYNVKISYKRRRLIVPDYEQDINLLAKEPWDYKS